MLRSETPKTKEPPTIWLVSDALWQQIAPLLKIPKPRKKPGSPRADDRRIFNGLIYLARTGSQWCALPAEYGPKSTAYDRYREWLEYGCLEKVWATLLQQYDQVIGIEWEWQAADGCIVKAPLGKLGVEGEAEATGRNPTDRGKSGCKRHLLTEGKGIPLAVVLSGANRHDMKKLADLLDAIVVERPDPQQVEQHLCLDQGYDYEQCRTQAHSNGYIAHIPDTSQPVPPPNYPNRHPPRRSCS